MRNPMMKVPALILIGLLSFTLASCRKDAGNANASSSSTPSSSVNGEQATVQGEAPQDSSVTSAASSPTSKAPDGGVTPALDAIPQGATRLEEARDAKGIWVNSPSENIHCWFANDLLQLCMVDSYREDQPYGDQVLFPGSRPLAKDSIFFAGYSSDKEVPYIAARRDGPLPANEGERSRALAYGQVVYAGNDVCASTSEAMVCWSIESGDGAKINRAGVEVFHLKK